MPISIKIADESYRKDWDQYVLKQSNAFHAHQWAWFQVFQQTFDQQFFPLIAEDIDGTIRGIFPLFKIQSLFFGSSLISVPYLNGGSLLSSSENVSTLLLNAAKKLSTTENCSYLEVRSRHQNSFLQKHCKERAHKVFYDLKLSPDPEKIFSEFPKKLRSQIRRPGKDGFFAEIQNPNEHSLQQFYSVFSRHMRDLGTPVYPLALFENCARAFGESMQVYLIKKNSLPVSAAITLRFQNRVEVPWAASLQQYRKYSPNMLLYWTMIQTACKEGCHFFDFGRSSPHSGTARFKEQWGSEQHSLFWYYSLNSGSIPDVSPKNKKFSLPVKIWRNLPLPLANILGPKITKNLP